ncbi:MAG: hypothetical protein DRN04_07405 [Thermoprotei archaeon]|nr:MAG: hypothetical protein DRN04_07405 [Thermoprotei archaeon]
MTRFFEEFLREAEKRESRRKKEQKKKTETREEKVKKVRRKIKKKPIASRKLEVKLPAKPKLSFLKRKKSVPKPQLIQQQYKYDYVERCNGYTYAFDLMNRLLYVWIGKDRREIEESTWGCLEALRKLATISEIHVVGDYVSVLDDRFGQFTVRFADYKFTKEEADFTVNNIAIAAKLHLTERTPVVVGDLEGFRVQCKKDLVGKTTQLVAVRLRKIPDLVELLRERVAAKLLTCVLTRLPTVFIGEPGSGKTTALNSTLLKLLAIFPKLNISVVETSAELRFPTGFSVHRTVCTGYISTEEALRKAFTTERPDILVLGELTDEVDIWMNFVRSGQACLTTFHSPDPPTFVRHISMKMNAYALDFFKLIVHCSRTTDSLGRRYYRINAAYIIDSQNKPHLLTELSEEEFLKILEEDYGERTPVVSSGNRLFDKKSLYMYIKANISKTISI